MQIRIKGGEELAMPCQSILEDLELLDKISKSVLDSPVVGGVGDQFYRMLTYKVQHYEHFLGTGISSGP